MINSVERSVGVSAASAPDVAEECCPTCGGLLDPPAPEVHWRVVRRPRWPWVFLALAAYLVVAFGAPAWSDYQTSDNALGWLRGTEGLPPGVAPDPRHYTLQHVEASALAWEAYVPAAEQLSRDVVALGLAAVATLLGLGALARGNGIPAIASSSTGKSHLTSPVGRSLRGLATVGWTPGEAIGLSFFAVLLVVFGYLATTGLVEGEQSFGLLFNNAVDRTLDVLANVVQLLQ